MPQGDSYEKLSGVIAAMGRLEKVFQGVISSGAKLKENIDKSDEMFGTSNRLKNELTAAVTSPVLFKKLNEVLSKNLGGKNTLQIKQNLAKASTFRKQYLASQKAQRKIGVQIATAQAQRPHARSAQALATLNRKIANLQAQHGTAGMNAFKQRWAMKAALTRSQKAALSKGSNVGTLSKLGMLSKAAGVAGIAIGVAVEGIKFFDEKIRESGQIIDKYSRFSVGGMHASSLMFIRDIHRNVESSRALGGSMLEFAKANADMKDSWKTTNIVLDKFTLALGTAGSKVGGAIGKFFEPIHKGFDTFMGGLNKGNRGMQALALAMGPLGAALIGVAKAADWKTQEEELQAVKDRIARRKAAIQQGNMGGLQKGDMGQFEANILGLRPKPGQQFGRFNHPGRPRFPANARGVFPAQGALGGNAVGPNGVMGAGGAQAPQNRGMAFNPLLDQVNSKLALTEKKIRIIEKAEGDLDRAALQRQTNIDKLEEGGVTPDEQMQINKKQKEIAQYGEKMFKLMQEEDELRKQRRLLKDQRDGLMRKDAVGYMNPWTIPGPMGRKQAGADLMEFRIA
jgi:hypothetical protein